MFFGLDGLDTANKSGRHRAARQTTKEILVATQKFTGVIPPVVVPDTEDHQLDVASFERSINRMIDAGVDGLFFLGSSVRSLRSWAPMRLSPPARSMPCRA